MWITIPFHEEAVYKINSYVPYMLASDILQAGQEKSCKAVQEITKVNKAPAAGH